MSTPASLSRRRLALSAAAAALGGSSAHALPADLWARVELIDARAVSLSWGGLSGPVRLSVSADRTMRRARPVTAPAMGPRAVASASVRPRPYFLLEDARGARLKTAERVLPLEGGVNFRDLGGYRSDDGRCIRWGLLFRSGVMHGLTLSDYAYLGDLGIVTVCDLRSAQERESPALAWPHPGAPKIVSSVYDASAINLDMKVASLDAALAMMAASYVEMTAVLARHQRAMYEQLLRGRAPLAFLCSAGKDRTGVVTAILLSVLGVPRRTILDDYALSARYFRAPPQPESGPFAAMAPDAFAVVMGADERILARALAAIDAECGGPVALAQTRYGLSNADVKRLRALYLE